MRKNLSQVLRNAGFSAAMCAVVCLAPARAQAGLVTNGGFETGDYTGWSGVQPCCDRVFLSPNAFGLTAHSGQYAENHKSIISQQIADTAGQVLLLNYYLSNTNTIYGPGGNRFSVAWNDVTIPGSELFNARDFAYQLFSFNVVATGLDLLEFRISAREPGGLDTTEYALDDVALTAVPEPASLPILLGGLAFAWSRRKS